MKYVLGVELPRHVDCKALPCVLVDDRQQPHSPKVVGSNPTPATPVSPGGSVTYIPVLATGSSCVWPEMPRTCRDSAPLGNGTPEASPPEPSSTPDSIADLSEARLRPQLSLPLSDGLLTRLEVEPREEITHRIGSQLSCPRHKFASPYVEGSPVRLQRTGLCRPNGGSPRCIRSRCPPDRHRPRRIPRLNHRAIAQRGNAGLPE